MSAAATKRKLLEQAHLLVKTNDPATTFIACAALLDALGTLLSECTGEVVRVRMTAEGQPDSLDMSKQPRRHGIDCEKAEHSREGYLHAEDDDTPYLVDGASYCGRCHKALYAALPASPPVGEPVGKRAEPVKCRHKGKINSGYDSGWDMTWCDDCGQITWCSDGIVSEKQSKRTDRQDWCKSHVLAFGCAKEARGGGLCQSWCGNGDCAVSLATPVPEAGASGAYLSWSGFNVRGDQQSIAEVKRLVERCASLEQYLAGKVPASVNQPGASNTPPGAADGRGQA